MVSRESTKKYEVCIFALSLNSHSLAAAKSFLLGGAHRQYFTHSITETKSKKMLEYLTAVVFGMVWLTCAAAPWYRTFCQATGYGVSFLIGAGFVLVQTVEEKIARHSESGAVTEREIVVPFNGDVADGMQWKFTPT
ncbi:cytochrome c oxidase assembly protein COX11, mitochondrial-like [Brassica napus]|nr:cytochrome c oxidase assembly protein COX11, mitochondrial-like [Brassica napus]